jgi:hypothetical protein
MNSEQEAEIRRSIIFAFGTKPGRLKKVLKGNPGVNRSIRGWLTTLCDVHYNERIEKLKGE